MFYIIWSIGFGLLFLFFIYIFVEGIKSEERIERERVESMTRRQMAPYYHQNPKPNLYIVKDK